MRSLAISVNRGSGIALVLLLVALLTFGPGSVRVFAQSDGDAATPDVQVEPTDEPVTEETPVPTEVIDTGDEQTPPSEEPVPTDTPEPTEDQTEATPPPTVPVELPSSLTYSIAAPIACAPVSGIADEPISAGGTLDYDCTFPVDLHGKNLSPDQIAVAWTVSASSESTWSVQLAAPAVSGGNWSDPGQHLAQIGSDHANLDVLSVTPAPADGQDALVDGRLTIAFQLRLERPQCTSDPVAFQVSAGATASTPGAPQATVVLDGAQPDPLTVTPSLAPLVVAAPVVSIESVTIDPVAFSLDDRTTSGVLTIHVENSTMQCSASDVAISVQAFVGTDISNSTGIVSVGALTGVPDGNYVALAPDAGTSLNAYVVVSTIEAGATPGSYTQTISFEVAVPGQISAGTFDVRASATVEERGP